MTEHPLPLSPAHAMAFTQAFTDRDAYISEQPPEVRHLIGFEESVPLPGCPYCWGDAKSVRWDVLAHEIWTTIEPCGHWFMAERPIIVERTDGTVTVWEEWMP